MATRVNITQIYNVLQPQSEIDPFTADITEFFAWLPMKLRSGHWVWWKTIYYRKLIYRGEEGKFHYDAGWYSSEELAMLKLKGET